MYLAQAPIQPESAISAMPGLFSYHEWAQAFTWKDQNENIQPVAS